MVFGKTCEDFCRSSFSSQALAFVVYSYFSMLNNLLFAHFVESTGNPLNDP